MVVHALQLLVYYNGYKSYFTNKEWSDEKHKQLFKSRNNKELYIKNILTEEAFIFKKSAKSEQTPKACFSTVFRNQEYILYFSI